MTLMVPLPWCKRPWALPFLPVLAPSKKANEKAGRKPIKGKRIHLKTVLEDPKRAWQLLTVNWYGGELKTVECLSFVCLWYHAGQLPIPLRIVMVKTPDGKNVAETFFSTDVKNEPIQIINWFVLRWNIEVTFEETRAHLGVETQRQWSDKAIQRSTPLLMGLYSVLTLIAMKRNETKVLLAQETTSWYDKNGELTFVDILVSIRRAIWAKRYFSKSENQPDFDKYTDERINSLIYHLSLAA